MCTWMPSINQITYHHTNYTLLIMNQYHPTLINLNPRASPHAPPGHRTSVESAPRRRLGFAAPPRGAGDPRPRRRTRRTWRPRRGPGRSGRRAGPGRWWTQKRVKKGKLWKTMAKPWGQYHVLFWFFPTKPSDRSGFLQNLLQTHTWMKMGWLRNYEGACKSNMMRKQWETHYRSLQTLENGCSKNGSVR